MRWLSNGPKGRDQDCANAHEDGADQRVPREGFAEDQSGEDGVKDESRLSSIDSGQLQVLVHRGSGGTDSLEGGKHGERKGRDLDGTAYDVRTNEHGHAHLERSACATPSGALRRWVNCTCHLRRL